jgi:chloramphenicol-sensitive protein RarD
LHALSEHITKQFEFDTQVYGLCLWQYGHPRIMAVAKQPVIVAKLVCSGFFIATSWTTLIFAVKTNRIAEAAFGFYVVPMFNVAIGRIIFKEKLSWAALFATVTALSGVVWLSLQLSGIPWISPLIAITFAIYSAIKKTIASKVGNSF